MTGELSLRQKLDVIRSCEYDFAELVLGNEEVAGLNAEGVAGFQAAATSTGVPILSLSAAHGLRLADRDETELKTVADQTLGLVEAAAGLACDVVLFAVMEPAPPAQVHDVVARCVLPAAERASELGVTIALEHVSKYPPHFVAELVERIAHPAVRMYFDIANCYFVGEHPITQAHRCAPHVAAVHVKSGPVTPLAAMPLSEVLEVFAGAGFTGRLCLEEASDGNSNTRHLLDARAVLALAGLGPRGAGRGVASSP